MMPAMIVGRVYDNREIYDWCLNKLKKEVNVIVEAAHENAQRHRQLSRW
jgi:hypothetical protein